MCRSLFSFYVRSGANISRYSTKNDEILESRHYFYNKLILL